ncbi:helix-turn-helix domain-containing protein [Streptomyces niveus]|uniref:helix-turn-helix domain-containing protein n=1 Tax=Streptomyces niveus TaxID=193462 RepID=UPI0036A6AC27
MHIAHLLRDESLGLRPLWCEDTMLGREISGVTATDLADPARSVRPGELVLSGLLWWTRDDGPAKAERFVSALRTAGAAALLAGEKAHGGVPDDLVHACRRHAVPVAAVPAHVMFRTITDSVQLRQRGGPGGRPALPEPTRERLNRLLAEGADPAALLDAAFAHLDRPAAYLLTSSGRTVAATTDAVHVPMDVPEDLPMDVTGVTVPVDVAEAGPYERMRLHLPEPADTPPRVLQEIAAILATWQRSGAGRRAAAYEAASALGALLTGGAADPFALRAALLACGLPPQGPYEVITAAPDRWALAEAVAQLRPGGAAVGALPDGTAFALLAAERPAEQPAESPTEPLAAIWPLVAACDPSRPQHAGTAPRADGPEDLNGALSQARYALASGRNAAPDTSSVTDAASFTGLAALLTGIPEEVRAAYSHTVLGSLLAADNASSAVLLQTLETFLARDGSWARAAEELHLHVNTVHYRIGRIEQITGRDLSRLDDRLDLRAALLCRGM